MAAPPPVAAAGCLDPTAFPACLMSRRSQVNGFQFHPSLPFVATASGHRRYLLAPDTDDSSSGSEDDGKASDGGGWLAPATSRRCAASHY